MERQLDHLKRLVDDLLDISRFMQGKIKLQKESIEVGRIVGQAVEACRPVLLSRSHQFVVTPLPGPCWVEADPDRLVQVLTNLVNNAARYTDPGGHIRLTVEREDELVILRVQDDGSGIEPELLPRVFDLFVQGEQSLTRSDGGLGIGLALVKRLVEMHGGSVTAASAGGNRGSTFVVRLPIVILAPSRSPLPSTENASGRGRRVLLVDDNTEVVADMAVLLQHLGHEVRTAYDGLHALEVAETFQPEIVVADIGMPGMDGWELAQRLRQLPAMAQVKLIAMSGYGQEDFLRRSREVGFDIYLVKPVGLKVLQEVTAAAP